MEIRNALQKIENYLTVVANLNKTILLEGTMSREELLLMKKYLYSSIERIEDIESLLVLDNKNEKEFEPTEQVIEYKKPAILENEIVEVQASKNIEEVEATLNTEEKEEVIAALEEIKEEELKIEEIHAIKSEEETVVEELPVIAEIKSEIVEPIIEVKNEIVEPIAEIKNEFVEPIIEVKNEIVEPIVDPIAEIKNEFVEPIVEVKNEIVEPVLEMKAEVVAPIIEQVVNTIPLVNEVEKMETTLVNVTPPPIPLIAKIETKTEPTFLEQLQQKIEAASETINTKFEVVKESNFVEQLKENYDITKTQVVDAIVAVDEKLTEEKIEENKVEQPLFFATVEQKIEKEEHKPLFSLFDDGKDELHETFSKKSSNDFSSISDVFSTRNETQENVLVAEKEVKTVIEQLTPSVISDVFKPIVNTETITSTVTKTLSESIALNDKFIFVRELFGNQFNEYDSALRILEKSTSYDEADKYCKENFWNKFNWNDKVTATDRFKELLQKRFA